MPNMDKVVGKITEKVKNTDNIQEKFENDPVKTVEDVIGMKLPESVNAELLTGFMAKIQEQGISSAMGEINSLLDKNKK